MKTIWIPLRDGSYLNKHKIIRVYVMSKYFYAETVEKHYEISSEVFENLVSGNYD